jgi:hypothetical protein
MTQTINMALGHSAGPVVVICGVMHLPMLHADLAGICDVIALATPMPIEDAQVSDRRKRYSYLLSNDDVFKFRPTPGYEDEPLDTRSYVESLGFDLRQPPAQALLPKAPWQRAGATALSTGTGRQGPIPPAHPRHVIRRDRT